MSEQTHRTAATPVVTSPEVIPEADVEAAGNSDRLALAGGLDGYQDSTFLASFADRAAGDRLGDGSAPLGFNTQAPVDVAGSAATYVAEQLPDSGRANEFVRRLGVDRLGAAPLTTAVQEGQGITGLQANHAASGLSLSAGPTGGGVGYGNHGLNVSADLRDRYTTLQQDGEAVGSRLDLATRLGANGTYAPGPIRLGAGVNYDGSTAVTAGAVDGEALDEQVLAGRAVLAEDRSLGSPEEATALMAAVSGWQEGDAVQTTSGLTGSLDLGIAGPAGFSVGATAEGVSERVLQSLGNGQVGVTTTNMSGAALRAGANLGFNALGVDGEVGSQDIETQSVAFDLTRPEGQRDFALNHYLGLMPGAADSLGITDLEGAVAFVEAGGFDAIASGDFEVPEDFDQQSAATLNAALSDRARRDAEFADANGYTSFGEEHVSRMHARAALLGVDLASVRSERRFGEETTVEGGVFATTQTGEAHYSQGGFFLEDGQSGTTIEADETGQFRIAAYDSFVEGAGDATGPMADLMREDSGVAELMDDPTYVQAISGDMNAVAEVLQGAEGNERLLDLVIHGLGRTGGTETRILGRPVGEGLNHLADATGLPVSEIIENARGDLAAFRAGESEVLSEQSAMVYGMVAMSVGGEERFDVLYDIAGSAPPDVMARVLATMVATGGPETAQDFRAWTEQHPELAEQITVESSVVGGSNDVRELVAGANTGLSYVGGENYDDRVLAGLEGISDPEAFEQVMTDLNRSAQGGAEGFGGVSRIFTALDSEGRARFLAAAGDSPLVRQEVLALASTRPDLLTPPNMPLHERMAFVEQQILPQLAAAGIEGVSVEELVGAGRRMELDGQMQRQWGAMGPDATVLATSNGDRSGVEMLVMAGLEGGAPAVQRLIEEAEEWSGGDVVDDLLSTRALGSTQEVVMLFEALQGTPYEAQLEERYLAGEFRLGEHVQQELDLFVEGRPAS